MPTDRTSESRTQQYPTQSGFHRMKNFIHSIYRGTKFFMTMTKKLIERFGEEKLYQIWFENNGMYKAAEIHKDMLNYLGITDKKLIEKGLNTLFEYYTKLNFGNIPSPIIKLNKKEDVVEQTAERDKILKDMGVTFSKEYFKKRYNLSDSDFELNEY